MEYVMVPVPEEVLDQVENFIKWEVGRMPMAIEDPAALRTLVHDFDKAALDALIMVAEKTQEGEAPELDAVAKHVGLGNREAVGMFTEVNFIAVRQIGGMGIVMLRPDTRPLPDDRTEFAHKVVMMPPEIVDAILG